MTPALSSLGLPGWGVGFVVRFAKLAARSVVGNQAPVWMLSNRDALFGPLADHGVWMHPDIQRYDPCSPSGAGGFSHAVPGVVARKPVLLNGGASSPADPEKVVSARLT